MPEIETGQPTGGDSGGTPSPSPSPTPGTGSPTPGTPAVGTTGSTIPAPSGFTYQEDRSQWIPQHRLREETTKRNAIQAELTAARNQVLALTGQQVPNPANEKSEQVKTAFFQMFPQFKHLAGLSEEQMLGLIQSPQQGNRAVEIEKREWQRHGAAQMKSLYSQVSEALGAEELNADQQTDLRESFGSWLRRTCNAELEASGGETSATMQKYEAGDPSLLTNFVKRYTQNWVEPARRKVTQQTLTRTRPVPNSGGRTQVSSIQRPATFKTLDERLDYAANLAKERGVQFGR